MLTAARSNVGRPLPGVRVLMDGDGIRQQALTNRRGIARFAVTPRSLGIVHFRRARVPVSAGTRCRTLLAVLCRAEAFGHRLSATAGGRSASRAAPAAPTPARHGRTRARSRARPPDRAAAAGSSRGCRRARRRASRSASSTHSSRATNAPKNGSLRHEAPLHVEVAADRRLRTGLPDRDHARSAATGRPRSGARICGARRRSRRSGSPRGEGRGARSEPSPAARSAGRAGSARTTRRGRPHALHGSRARLELLVAAQTMQHAQDPRVRVGRCANRRTRRDELPGRGQPHRRCVRRRGGRRPEHDGHAEGEKQCAEACAS